MESLTHFTSSCFLLYSLRNSMYHKIWTYRFCSHGCLLKRFAPPLTFHFLFIIHSWAALSQSISSHSDRVSDFVCLLWCWALCFFTSKSSLLLFPIPLKVTPKSNLQITPKNQLVENPGSFTTWKPLHSNRLGDKFGWSSESSWVLLLITISCGPKFHSMLLHTPAAWSSSLSLHSVWQMEFQLPQLPT